MDIVIYRRPGQVIIAKCRIMLWLIPPQHVRRISDEEITIGKLPKKYILLYSLAKDFREQMCN